MKFLVCLGLLCALPAVVTGSALPNATEMSNGVEGIKPESDGGALKSTGVDGTMKTAGEKDVNGDSRVSILVCVVNAPHVFLRVDVRG